MHKFLNRITGWELPIERIHLYLLGGIIMIYLLTMKMGIMPAFLFACLPALVIGLMLLLQKPIYSFLAFFVLNYVIMGINRYYSVRAGILMSALGGILLFIVLLQGLGKRVEWYRSHNLSTYLWCIWMAYCLLELANPEALWEPWSIAITFQAFYPLLLALLVPLVFNRFNYMKWFLVFWGILTILAAMKGYWQRNHGFDPVEYAWIMGRGAHTHIIHSGIRYFSFFTDAANFGCSMGFSLTFFSIAGFYVRKLPLKLFFWVAALAGGYGMLIAGTRTALAIPLVGLVVYLISCRSVKNILIAVIALVGIVFFFKFTDIGNDNRYIRRMRTAFDFKDASLMVRSYNKEKIWNYVKDRPFGAGLGLGDANAARFKPSSPIANIPTDSYLIRVLAETGYVGFVIYLLIFVLLILKGIYIASKEIKNKQLRGILLAMLAGICGILTASYTNDIFGFPNGILTFFLFGFIYSAKYYDKELSNNERTA